MSTIEVRAFSDKVTKGFTLAVKMLVESIKKEDGEIVIGENGKAVRIKAKDLK